MDCHKKELAVSETFFHGVIDGWADGISVRSPGLRVDQFQARRVDRGHSWIRLGLLGCPECSWKQQRWPAAISARRMNTAMHKENQTPLSDQLMNFKANFPRYGVRGSILGEVYGRWPMSEGQSEKEKEGWGGGIMNSEKSPVLAPHGVAVKWQGKRKGGTLRRRTHPPTPAINHLKIIILLHCLWK